MAVLLVEALRSTFPGFLFAWLNGWFVLAKSGAFSSIDRSIGQTINQKRAFAAELDLQ